MPFATIAEDVRMPPFHLVADRRHDIGEGEVAGFLGDPAVEDDLKQQVAEFVLQIGHIATRDRVGDFIGFFNGIRRNRREALCAIPFAAGFRIAQARHDREQPIDHARGPFSASDIMSIIYIM